MSDKNALVLYQGDPRRDPAIPWWKRFFTILVLYFYNTPPKNPLEDESWQWEDAVHREQQELASFKQEMRKERPSLNTLEEKTYAKWVEALHELSYYGKIPWQLASEQEVLNFISKYLFRGDQGYKVELLLKGHVVLEDGASRLQYHAWIYQTVCGIQGVYIEGPFNQKFLTTLEWNTKNQSYPLIEEVFELAYAAGVRYYTPQILQQQIKILDRFV